VGHVRQQEGPVVNDLGSQWSRLGQGARLALGVGGVLVVLLVVLKILSSGGVATLLVVLAVPYWIPTVVAFIRGHQSKLGILALNLFLGWTFIGWVIALVWSLSETTSQTPTVVINQAMPAALPQGDDQRPV
jgi:hypothetical protein